MIRCIPSDDADLAACAEQAFAQAPLDADDIAVAEFLRAAIATTYPAVAVVPMHPLAKTAHERLWYVYRDGRA